MSIVLPHAFDIETALHKKYQNTFAFYKVKTINEILYGYRRKNFIDLCDARVYAEDAEFLRRFYHYYTLTGREELMPRLKLCGQYYAKNQMISYEYPMMIITNTKSLFLRRNKRLRKIQAGEASSDESQGEEDRGDFWEDKPDILGDMDNSSLEASESYQIEYEFEFDEQEHDIFATSHSQLPGDEVINFINIKDITESDVQHLVQDMALPSSKSPPEKYESIVSKAQGELLQNIQNKLKNNISHSISIVPIEQTLLKSSLRLEKISSSSSSKKDAPREDGGVGRVSYARLSSKFDNPIIDQYKPGESVTVDTCKQEKEERQQLQSRRRKIREKAEELLRRVRKEESLQCF